MIIVETKISLPKKINGLSFENCLSLYYYKSLSSALVKFDFSLVEWCELFELSLITLWIKELLAAGRKVKFFTPNSPQVKSFLSKFEFGRFLGEHGINSDLRYVNVGGAALESTTYFPIKFHHEQSFRDLIAYLADAETYKTAFADIINAGFVNKEYLRNIIIQELGDNMFRHADGMFASNTMAKFGRQSSDRFARIEWRNALVKNSSAFEKTFFESLGGNDYFTVVFSDKGPGIYETLKKNFEETQPSAAVNECDVLEYAFVEYSTSRTIKERLGDLAEIYENFNDHSGKPPVMPPPTGLYLMLNIVRQYKGLVYVRSGRSIIVYDFFNERPVMKSRDTPGYKRLTNFKGTQIKLHFPIDIAKAVKAAEQQRFLFPETQKNIQYAYFNIADYFVESNKDNYSAEKNSFFKFYQDVDNFKSQSAKSLRGIILDLAELRTISNKALYLVIAKLMNSQEQNYSHVLINAGPQAVTSLKATFNASSESLKPIILFDIFFNRNILGVTVADEFLFEGLFAKRYFFDDQNENRFLSKHDHLFILDDTVTFKHRRKAIFSTARYNIGLRLKQIILDTSYRIYYPDIKAQLPSRIFCGSYFELDKLFDIAHAKSLVKQWVTYLLFENRPTHILAVGRPCSQLVEDIVNERAIAGLGVSFKHLAIKAPDSVDFTYLNEIESEFFESQKVMVLCDVVGTTATLRRLLQHLLPIAHIEIIAIINATTVSAKFLEIERRKISLDAVVVQPVKFYDRKPLDWDDDDIVLIDKSTNTVTKQVWNRPAPLWAGWAEYEFIENVIIPDNKYLVGHFTYDYTHITYLLDIPLITKTYGDIISDTIIDHFTTNELTKESKSNQGKVLFLHDKQGLTEVVRKVGNSLFFSIEKIANDDLYLNPNLESNEYHKQIILALDDAFDSGENMLRMIDLCARRGAKKICVYALFKRGSDYSVRKLSNLKLYGKTEVSFHYLAEVNIPTYNVISCPVCRRRSQLEHLRNRLRNDKGLQTLTEYLDNELVHTEAVNIENISPDHYSFERFQTAYENDDIYSRIILEKASTELLSRDYVISIINTYKEGQNLKNVLALFKIIVREQLFAIIDKKVGDDDYEYGFRSGIIRVCLHCMNDTVKLQLEQLDCVLDLIRHLDEDRFLEKLAKVLIQVANDQKRLLIVLKHLFSCQKAYNFPNHVLAALRTAAAHEETLPILRSTLSYWEALPETPDIPILRTIEKLRTCNHEIQSHVDIIKGAALKLLVDDIRPDIVHLLDYLNKVCVGLSELSEFDFENISIKKYANELLGTLRNLNDRGQELITSYSEKDFLPRLLKLLHDIDFGLYKEDFNLTAILDLVVSNLSKILISLLHLFENKFAGVELNLIETETAGVAFGDKNGLESVFSNILKNIHKHAQPKKVLIHISIENNSQDIVVRFYDDGNKLPAYVTPHVGLTTCRKNTARYFGMFNLLALSDSNPYRTQGFNKEAVVILKYIKQRNEIDYKT